MGLRNHHIFDLSVFLSTTYFFRMASNLRRSERIQSKKTSNNVKGIAPAVENTKPTAKTQKGTNRASKRRKVEDASTAATQVNNQVARPDCVNVKGRRGRLESITEIPLDALYEIFRHLEPIDLLHLS